MVRKSNYPAAVLPLSSRPFLPTPKTPPHPPPAITCPSPLPAIEWLLTPQGHMVYSSLPGRKCLFGCICRECKLWEGGSQQRGTGRHCEEPRQHKGVFPSHDAGSSREPSLGLRQHRASGGTAGCREILSLSPSLDTGEDRGADPARKALSAGGKAGLLDWRAGSGLTWWLSRCPCGMGLLPAGAMWSPVSPFHGGPQSIGPQRL